MRTSVAAVVYPGGLSCVTTAATGVRIVISGGGVSGRSLLRRRHARVTGLVRIGGNVTYLAAIGHCVEASPTAQRFVTVKTVGRAYGRQRRWCIREVSLVSPLPLPSVRPTNRV